jgi:hypothetical protein
VQNFGYRIIFLKTISAGLTSPNRYAALSPHSFYHDRKSFDCRDKQDTPNAGRSRCGEIKATKHATRKVAFNFSIAISWQKAVNN